MSTGQFRMMWTILADIVGLLLSYLYGAIFPALVGNWLPKPLAFVRSAAFRTYSLPLKFLHLPLPIQAVLLRNPGLSWLFIALLFHLGYLLAYLLRRRSMKGLGSPHPGGNYWNAVQLCLNSYYEASKRWSPPIELKMPKWVYYKRLQTSDPDFSWRGRMLIIEMSLLEQSRLQDLGPGLARELMYYNCDDVVFEDILAYYPDRFSWLQIVCHLTGFCILLPLMLLKRVIWPSYWNKRVKIADMYAYLLGQGSLLYHQIHGQIQQEEAIKRERQQITRKIAELSRQLHALEIEDNSRTWSFPISEELYGHRDNSRERLKLNRQKLEVSLNELQRSEAQLAQQELLVLQIHPMLEERREQLVGLLRNEQVWMTQHGILAPAPVLTIP